MKSSIAFNKEDIDLLQVTMTFTFSSMNGPRLRKKLDELGYKLYPMDKARLTVNKNVAQIGQANTAIRNEFAILRHYEIPEDYEQHEPAAKEHAERYYGRVIEDLKVID